MNSFKKVAVVLALALCTASLYSCSSSRKTVNTKTIERSTVLGDQEKPLGAWVSCKACDGKGACVRCKGTGKVNGKKCNSCDGTGKCSVCGGEGGYRSE